jgi:response regulator NasT
MSTSSKIRVLIVADQPLHADLLSGSLRNEGMEPIGPISTAADFGSHLESTSSEVLLIDTPFPTPALLNKVAWLNQRSAAPVVMLSAEPDSKYTVASIDAGVSAYVVNGICSMTFKPYIDVAIARFRQSQLLRQALHQSQATVKTHSVIDRAKAILMKQQNIDEDSAHRTLQKMAMNLKRKLVDVARELVDNTGATTEAQMMH